MAPKIKTDVLGNKIVLSKNTLYYYNPQGKLIKTVTFTQEKSAKKEFNRVTCSYRGCGKHQKYHHPQARVYYTQLIIQT